MLLNTHELTFTFLNVGGGDAIWIRFLGNDNKWHNILIDGGYGYTYKDAFGPLINQIIKEECVDFWIITHTDRDHIGAVLGFIQDSKIKDKKAAVKQFWFNHSPLSINEATGKLGVGQGIKLRSYLENNGLLVTQEITTDLLPADFWGLRLTVLSPSDHKLSIANALWKEKELQGKLGRPRTQADHGKTIDELKNDNFSEDNDPWNGSSIACLLEYKGHTALLLSDSHPSVVAESLNKADLKQKLPLEASVVQLSHHGSKANNSQALLALVTTSTFVITGNGITNQHPDKETLVRILTQKERNDRELELVFPVETIALTKLFSVDTDAFKKYNFRCTYPLKGNNFTAIEFLPITGHQL